MNKAQSVEEVANQTGLTKKTSREAADAITSIITDILAREDKVTWLVSAPFRLWKEKQGEESILRQEELSRSQLKKSLGLDRGRV
jgi:nucleoid DNA-binding protein